MSLHETDPVLARLRIIDLILVAHDMPDHVRESIAAQVDAIRELQTRVVIDRELMAPPVVRGVDRDRLVRYPDNDLFAANLLSGSTNGE